MHPSARAANRPAFPWWCIVAGSAFGVMGLHPYAMSVQRFLSSEGQPDALTDALRWSLHAFAPHMWPMMAFYALMGAAIGWGFAFFWDRQMRIAAHRSGGRRAAPVRRGVHMFRPGAGGAWIVRCRPFRAASVLVRRQRLG